MEIHEETIEMISGEDMDLKMTQHDELTEMLVGEVLVMSLLGKALYQEPERAWLETLVADQIFDESPLGATQPEVARGLEILQRWSQEAGGISEQGFQEIKMDYTKLFIGLGNLTTAPWESVYFNRERLVLQEQTLQVREWYLRFGLQAEKINKEPDDHIGLEMLFIAHLASLALKAIENEDKELLDQIIQAQKEFLSEHLLRWGFAWAKLVKQHAATDFYRGFAHLTHGSLLAIAETLQVKMPKEVSL